MDLGSETPVYGIELSGSTDAQAYVTSFSVLHSDDGRVFSYIEEQGQAKVFRGPYDPSTPIEVLFPQPVEARYVRLSPKTWQGAVAVRFDVFTCSHQIQEVPGPSFTRPVGTLPEDIEALSQVIEKQPQLKPTDASPQYGKGRTPAPSINSSVEDPSALMAILSQVPIILNQLDSIVSPENLAPYTDAIEALKDNAKEIMEEFAKTGSVNMDKLSVLQNMLLDIQDISELKDHLTNPEETNKITKTSDSLNTISAKLKELLNLSTIDPSEETSTLATTGKELGELLAILIGVESSLDQLESNVNPESLAPYTDAIEAVKDTVKEIREELKKTGILNENQLLVLQTKLLAIQDVSDLKVSLTDPKEIDQISNTTDILINIGAKIQELLKISTIVPSDEPSTLASSNIEPGALVAILSSVHTALNQLESNVNPESLAPYADAMGAVKETTKEILEEYMKTGHVNVDKLSFLHSMILDLQVVSQLQNSLSDPLEIDQVKKASEDVINIGINLAKLLNLSTTTTPHETVPGVLMAVLSQVTTTMNQLESNINPESLSPYTETIDAVKKSTKGLLEELEKTGNFDINKLLDLQTILINLQEVSELENILTDPLELGQVKKTVQDLIHIGITLVDLLNMSSTAAPTRVNIGALVAILNKVPTTLDQLESNVNPEILAPYTDTIEVVKQTARVILENYEKTGVVDVVKLSNVYSMILDLQELATLQDSLTSPLEIGQVKKTSEDLNNIGINLALLLNISTTSIPETTTTPAKILDRDTLIEILKKLQSTLNSLELNVDPTNLAPYSEDMKSAKTMGKGIWQDYEKTGEVNMDKLVQLHTIILDLKAIANLQTTLNDPTGLEQVKLSADDLTDLDLTLGGLLRPGSGEVCMRQSRAWPASLFKLCPNENCNNCPLTYKQCEVENPEDPEHMCDICFLKIQMHNMASFKVKSCGKTKQTASSVSVLPGQEQEQEQGQSQEEEIVPVQGQVPEDIEAVVPSKPTEGRFEPLEQEAEGFGGQGTPSSTPVGQKGHETEDIKGTTQSVLEGLDLDDIFGGGPPGSYGQKGQEQDQDKPKSTRSSVGLVGQEEEVKGDFESTTKTLSTSSSLDIGVPGQHQQVPDGYTLPPEETASTISTGSQPSSTPSSYVSEGPPAAAIGKTVLFTSQICIPCCISEKNCLAPMLDNENGTLPISQVCVKVELFCSCCP